MRIRDWSSDVCSADLLHGGTIESLVLLADDLATVGDPVGTTGGKLAEERAVLDQHLPLVERLAGIHLQLGPGVGDVEVAHGELADPVQGTEGCVVGALHRQLVGVVGEVAARGGRIGRASGRESGCQTWRYRWSPCN